MRLSLLAVPITLSLSLACGGSDAPAPQPAEPAKPAAEASTQKKAEVPAQIKALFEAVPAREVAEEEQALVDLGRMLYYDERLSAGQNQSCNTCHQLDNWGVDGEATSPGSFGKRGDRNSPSVYYAFGHVAQFWDGRAADLVEQAKGPILNPVEMAIPDEGYAVRVLQSIPGYAEAFKAAFPDDSDPITYDNLAKAIGVFEAYLVTPSPFDAWLEGDDSGMSPEAKKGAEVFIQTGCTACHMGPFLGGSQYQKLGLVKPYETEDIGRAKVTGNDADKFVFKVPSLRNIEKTGPYFHDGSIESLDEAIKLMATHQLGRELSDDQVASIRAFLASLTGEIPTELIRKPTLPESGPDTPGPLKEG